MWMTEDVIKQQYLLLSRQYSAAAETIAQSCKEWEAAAKRLDRCATFLAQAGSVTLEWENLSGLIPSLTHDDSCQAVSQAKTIARAVAERFDLLAKLQEGLPHLKAALVILGHTANTASDIPRSGPPASQRTRALTSNQNATLGVSAASGAARVLPGTGRLSTIEQLRRGGWLTAHPRNQHRD